MISLPALRALRSRFPRAHIAILAKPWVADLYRREPVCDEIIPRQVWEYEIETKEGSAQHFHFACYTAWYVERQLPPV